MYKETKAHKLIWEYIGSFLTYNSGRNSKICQNAASDVQPKAQSLVDIIYVFYTARNKYFCYFPEIRKIWKVLQLFSWDDNPHYQNRLCVDGNQIYVIKAYQINSILVVSNVPWYSLFYEYKDHSMQSNQLMCQIILLGRNAIYLSQNIWHKCSKICELNISLAW